MLRQPAPLDLRFLSPVVLEVSRSFFHHPHRQQLDDSGRVIRRECLGWIEKREAVTRRREPMSPGAEASYPENQPGFPRYVLSLKEGSRVVLLVFLFIFKFFLKIARCQKFDVQKIFEKFLNF